MVRERILDPLALDDTYLSFYEDGPDPFGGYNGATFAGNTVTEDIDFDFTSYATAAWAAGGLVSTGPDLHTLMAALFDGSLIAESLVAEMTKNAESGFGIQAPGVGIRYCAVRPRWQDPGRGNVLGARARDGRDGLHHVER